MQIRQLRLEWTSLTAESAKTLVYAFVSSRNAALITETVCCNRISDELLQKLQVIQNAAASVVTGARKFDHISPVLHELRR